jgi:hypothetical protein
VLLRDQPLDPVSKKSTTVLRIGIRPCARGEEEFLMLERLGIRPIEGPVLLVLVELLKAFYDNDRRTEYRSNGWIRT